MVGFDVGWIWGGLLRKMGEKCKIPTFSKQNPRVVPVPIVQKTSGTSTHWQ